MHDSNWLNDLIVGKSTQYASHRASPCLAYVFVNIGHGVARFVAVRYAKEEGARTCHGYLDEYKYQRR